MTGDATTAGGALRAFLYDGTMHDLGTLGGNSSQGYGINASGYVVGNSGGRAFLYDGTMHDLGSLGENSSFGFGINDSGQVTGFSAVAAADQPYHAFLYDGSMHDLGTLGGDTSAGLAINASGQVTGYSTPFARRDSTRHAFLYDGTMHDLGTLGGTLSDGWGINASGQVTGGANTTGDLAYHAFVYDLVHGMVDLNSLISPTSGWILEEAHAINDVGQITGRGTIGGHAHAFLLTPIVPEPSSLMLAGLGLVGWIVWALKRRAKAGQMNYLSVWGEHRRTSFRQLAPAPPAESAQAARATRRRSNWRATAACTKSARIARSQPAYRRSARIFGMKLLQFRVRTLLLLTAIMGVVFVACAKWPVFERLPSAVPPPGVNPPNFSSFIPASGTKAVPVKLVYAFEIKRPPTFTEWAIRASIASAILLAVFVLIGAWRARRPRAVAADVAPRPASVNVL